MKHFGTVCREAISWQRINDLPSFCYIIERRSALMIVRRVGVVKEALGIRSQTQGNFISVRDQNI